MTAPDRRPAPWALALAFALVYICWGTTYLAMKKGVREECLPPLLFGGVRLALAGLLIIGLQALRGQPLRLLAIDRATVGLCAVLMFVGGNGLINVAGQTLDSGLCAVLAATTPLWIGLFEIAWPQGDRLSARGWLGLVLGLAGVVLLCVPEMQKSSGLAVNVGIWAALGSACFWALGSLVSRHHRVSCSHLTASGYELFLGGTLLTLIGLAIGEFALLPDHINGTMVASFVWLLIAGSLMGFLAFNWLLTHVPVSQVGTYAYVNPAIAVVIGIFDHEEATIWLLAGIVVILLGVTLVRSGLTHRQRM